MTSSVRKSIDAAILAAASADRPAVRRQRARRAGRRRIDECDRHPGHSYLAVRDPRRSLSFRSCAGRPALAIPRLLWRLSDATHYVAVEDPVDNPAVVISGRGGPRALVVPRHPV